MEYAPRLQQSLWNEPYSLRIELNDEVANGRRLRRYKSGDVSITKFLARGGQYLELTVYSSLIISNPSTRSRQFSASVCSTGLGVGDYAALGSQVKIIGEN